MTNPNAIIYRADYELKPGDKIITREGSDLIDFHVFPSIPNCIFGVLYADGTPLIYKWDRYTGKSQNTSSLDLFILPGSPREKKTEEKPGTTIYEDIVCMKKKIEFLELKLGETVDILGKIARKVDATHSDGK